MTPIAIEVAILAGCYGVLHFYWTLRFKVSTVPNEEFVEITLKSRILAVVISMVVGIAASVLLPDSMIWLLFVTPLVLTAFFICVALERRNLVQVSDQKWLILGFFVVFIIFYQVQTRTLVVGSLLVESGNEIEISTPRAATDGGTIAEFIRGSASDEGMERALKALYDVYREAIEIVPTKKYAIPLAERMLTIIDCIERLGSNGDKLAIDALKRQVLTDENKINAWIKFNGLLSGETIKLENMTDEDQCAF